MMANLDLIWQKYAGMAGVYNARPDFRFDPTFYAKSISKPDATAEALLQHYKASGEAQKKPTNFYQQLRAEQPKIDLPLALLVHEPILSEAIKANVKGALELAFELIRLGHPVDGKVSDFSMQVYLNSNQDVANARIDPLKHYLCFGSTEGRKTLVDLLSNQHSGKIPFSPDRPTCLIAVHEMSRTGAPIVGRDLAREASLTHNVIVCALRGGDLLDDFCATACEVVISPQPLDEFPFFKGEVFDRIDFAIANSVECFPFARLLVARQIPFAAYIHEYADYTFPVYKSTITSLFADLLVFSSEHVRQSWLGRLQDIEFDLERDSTIIPQRPVLREAVSADLIAAARKRLSAILGRDLSKVRLICGAGHLQWRKGSDIFAVAAQIGRHKDPNTVFLWIGDGLNAEDMNFGVWMDYHLRQIGANDPNGNLFLLPAGPAYLDVMMASDAMFLSSRIDPLPNVVFDAVKQGCRVVLFEGGSGFGDANYAETGLFTKVEYGNPAAAVEALLSLPLKSAVEIAPTKTLPSGEHAPTLFESLHRALQDRLDAQTYFVRGESAFDLSVLYTKAEADRPLRILEREKMLRYRRRLIWRDIDEARETLAQSDNWIHKSCRIVPYARAEEGRLPPFSIHIHAHYTDELEQDLQARRAYSLAKRIVVTTDTPQKALKIEQIFAAQNLRAEVLTVPNRGRDILPFLDLFRSGGTATTDAAEDDIWCHVHLKKSLSSAKDGDIWRRFLMRILLGDTDEISAALSHIGQEGAGMVAPFDPNHVPWYGSRALLPRFADRLPGPLPRNPLVFPVGNMFWVRRQVVEAMNALFGPDYAWPNEPIANDGTEFHLIERLWPAMTAQCGLDAVFVHKPDEQRG